MFLHYFKTRALYNIQPLNPRSKWLAAFNLEPKSLLAFKTIFDSLSNQRKWFGLEKFKAQLRPASPRPLFWGPHGGLRITEVYRSVPEERITIFPPRGMYLLYRQCLAIRKVSVKCFSSLEEFTQLPFARTIIILLELLAGSKWLNLVLPWGRKGKWIFLFFFYISFLKQNGPRQKAKRQPKEHRIRGGHLVGHRPLAVDYMKLLD